jgi:flagellar basal-body rod modification protein FlgD
MSSIASVAAQQSAAASSSSTTAASQSAQNALGSLSNNFQTFLGMLLTQLQNQDPTSPMDTNQFTQELVEFSGVEQQINTNSSLTQLIQLTQAGDVIQSAAMTGKEVAVQSSQLSLQNSNATVQFTATTAGPATITIADANGMTIDSATVNASAGSNTWTWNGATLAGTTEPDGAYTVTVNQASSSGTGTTLPFTVLGTVTGVVQQSGTMDVQLGGLVVPFSAVQSVVSGP